MLRRASLVFVLSALFGLSAAGQDPKALTPISPAPGSAPIPRHITVQLFSRPSGQRALRQFRREQAQRSPVEAKRSAVQPDTGDTHIFQVLNTKNNTYEAITFTLKRKEARFNLWVANDQFGENKVRERDLDSLTTALNDRTPAGSVDPQSGVIVNDESVFGSPPNVDGDGKSDVLLVDIVDDYDPPENPSFVAGFVNPADLDKDGPGNYRDILYLDAFPGIYSGEGENVDYRGSRSVAATAAHEYQHLIMANYDGNEEAFVNEGLSEFAEIANGYAPRPADYLANPSAYDVRLLNWDGSLQAYQRAGLFTHYIAERIGVMATGRITRQEANGISGYNDVLGMEGENFQQLLFGFHTANFLNDPSVDPRFGYQHPGRQGVHAEPTRVVDGRTTTETAKTNVGIMPGAPYYVAWDRVKDFSLTLNATGSDRHRMRARAVLYSEGQSPTVRKVPLDGSTVDFSGKYDRVAAVLVNASPTLDAKLSYHASWASEQTFSVTTETYDEGQLQQGENNFAIVKKNELLTRFKNPKPEEGAFLGGVKLPVYYYSQFSNAEAPPKTAPRDFELVIRGVAPDGAPTDTTLFTLTRDDPRSYEPLTSYETDFVELDLSDYAGQLGDLPNEFYAGFRNAGGDDNFIVLAVSPYDTENVSYIGSKNWKKLWGVSITDGPDFNHTVLPVRAQFLVPDGTPVTPSPAGPPDAVALHSAYPNPFAGQTTLSYDLPEPARVTVTVYDALGREVAAPVDEERQAAGMAHRIRFDGSRLSPGVYFVVLRTGNTTRTGKMVHVR